MREIKFGLEISCVCLILAIFNQSVISFPSARDDETDSVSLPEPNEFLDSVLSNVRQQITEQHLDPFKFVDRNIKENIRMVGKIHGISTIKRKTDAKIEFVGEKISVNTAFELENVWADVSLISSLFGLVGKATLNVDSVAAEIFVVGSLENGMHLKKFNMINIGEIRLHQDGFGLLGGIAENIANLLVNQFKYQLVSLFEANIMVMVNKEMEKMMANSENELFR